MRTVNALCRLLAVACVAAFLAVGLQALAVDSINHYQVDYFYGFGVADGLAGCSSGARR